MSRGKYKRKRERVQEDAREWSEQDGLPGSENILSGERGSSPQAEEPEDSGKREASMRLREVAKRSSVTDWCIALFTLALVGTAIYQGFMMRGQLAAMGNQLDEMRIDQRPWLEIKLSDEGIRTPINQYVNAPIVLTNTGKTPMKSVHGWIVFRSYPENASPDFDLDPLKISSAELKAGRGIPFSEIGTEILFPNNPLPINGVDLTSDAPGPGDSMYERWAQPMQDEFDRGEIYLGTYGKLTYKDFNGKEHWTQFCSLSVSKKYPHPPPIEASKQCIAFQDVDNEK